MNVLVKYADDTNLLVPSDSDLDLSTEFDNIKQWAMENRMVVNILKTKEVVLGSLIPDWMSVRLHWWCGASCLCQIVGHCFKSNASF